MITTEDKMEIIKTELKDCYILKPKIFRDERGYFFESFNQNNFNSATGLDVNFVQDNESESQYGTIRGLHMQKGDFAQAKLVRVVKGKVKDVVIDVRPESPSFGQKFEIELSEENKTQLFVPKGFLHGFSVLSDKAIFSYKCDEYYDKSSETGVNPLDLDLNIDWGISKSKSIISEKDINAQSFTTFINNLEE